MATARDSGDGEAREPEPIAGQLGGFLERASLPCLVIDPEAFSIAGANGRALAWLGAPRDGIEGQPVTALFPNITEPVWRRLARPLLSGLRPSVRIQTEQLQEDAGSRLVEIELELFDDPDRPLLLARLSGATRQTASAEALGQSEALLRSIIDTAPDAIITIDASGTIESFSPAAEKIFGYAAEEVIGRDVSMLMPTPHKVRHGGYIERYLKTGEKHVIGIGRETTGLRKNGERFAIELAVGELIQGGRHFFTGFIRDIGDRVAAERRATELQREITHVARLSAVGEMSTTIAHELNQPLAAIANYSLAAKNQLAGQPPDIAKAVGFMEEAGEQSRRAGEIIRRLRSFARHGETERRPVDINDIVREAAQLSLIGASAAGVRTAFELAEPLPSVLADGIQIQQVVVNLVRNALDAMVSDEKLSRREIDFETAYGTQPTNLRVAAALHGEDYVAVAVHDSGPGIDQSIADKLFEPFVTTKQSGLGIGLSVCKSIVEAHDGRLWVETNDMGGTTFYFTLPIHREDDRW